MASKKTSSNSSESSSSTSSTTTSSTTSSSKKSAGWGFNSILNILAFVAVCVGGIALFIAMILSKVDVSAGFVGALQKIANAIGWAVLTLLSFRYIRKRRKIWLWVVWTIAVVMIVVGIILV